MSEHGVRPRWAWRCTVGSCGAKETQPLSTEDAARLPADEHRRTTGHAVAWGLLAPRGIR